MIGCGVLSARAYRQLYESFSDDWEGPVYGRRCPAWPLGERECVSLEGRIDESLDEEGSFSMPDLHADDLTTQELGALGEQVTVHYLKGCGYRIEQRNWTCPCGEADIIARDPDTGEVVLIEVKTRLATGRMRGELPVPELAVGERKQARYRRIAECYMGLNDVEAVRFDVVGVTIVADGPIRLHHLSGAFVCDAL